MWARVASTMQGFFWKGQERKGLEEGPKTESRPGIVAEACTFLEGRAADVYACHGRPLPYWAWLNALAHRPPGALRAVATAYPWGSLTAKTISIADQFDLLSADEALAVQAEALVPAELVALAGRGGSPDELVCRVRRQVKEVCWHRQALR